MTPNKVIPIHKSIPSADPTHSSRQDQGESPFPASFQLVASPKSTASEHDDTPLLGKSSGIHPRPGPLLDSALQAKIDVGFQLIDEYYARLSNTANINIRPQQVKLSRRVFEGFMRKVPSFNQAPTGTGKTLAYLVGAIAASQCSLVSKPPKQDSDSSKNTQKTNPPVVIATATVTLLDQIIHKDIPLLLRANIPVSFSSIKGRQRYYCPNSASIVSDELRNLDPQLSMLTEDASSHQFVDEFERQLHIQRFEHAFNTKQWNGELETYSGPTKYWGDVKAHPDTCLQSSCDHYDVCPFFKARKQMNTVDVLVTTHDFVLQDLSMKKDENAQPLLREEYYLVLDEAHQFPLKAHKLGSVQITPLAIIEKLHIMDTIPELLYQFPKLRALLEKQNIRTAEFNSSTLRNHLNELHSLLLTSYNECLKQVPHTLKKELERPQFKRLRNDMALTLSSKITALKNTAKLCARITAPDLQQPSQKLVAIITPALAILQDISTQLDHLQQSPPAPSSTAQLTSNPLSPYYSSSKDSSSFAAPLAAFDTAIIEKVYPLLRQYILAASPEASISQTRYSELLTAVSNASPLPMPGRLSKHILDLLIEEHKHYCSVAWLDASTCPEGVNPADFQPQLSLYGESLAGTQRLRELLWEQPLITPAFLSATLGNISAFKIASGLPPEQPSFTLSLPHIFDYSQFPLRIVDTIYSPRYEQRAEFLTELSRELPLVINPFEATLILCPNRKTLRKVQAALLSTPRIDPASVLVQGTQGLQTLIDAHKKRVDQRLGSILCGVESLCEGLDLPDRYCTHVIITAIPFAATTSPVEQEWQNVLQKDYFKERLLPQTLIKLIQMIGRLIRRETDYGKITLFDNRLLAAWAQKEIMPHIPPFQRIACEPPSQKTEQSTLYTATPDQHPSADDDVFYDVPPPPPDPCLHKTTLAIPRNPPSTPAAATPSHPGNTPAQQAP